MGTFNDVLKPLTVRKAREATLTEAQQNSNRFDKYFNLIKSRAIEPLYLKIRLPANFQATNTWQTYEYIGRLVFQYNVTLPVPMVFNGFFNVNGVSSALYDRIIMCIKWRYGNTVTRYLILGNPMLGAINTQIQTHFISYSGQIIPQNVCFEAYINLADDQGFGKIGVLQDLYIRTPIYRMPVNYDDVIYQQDATLHAVATPTLPLDDLGYVGFPEPLPTDQTNLAFLSN